MVIIPVDFLSNASSTLNYVLKSGSRKWIKVR